MRRFGSLIFALALQALACGAGHDEVVGIQVTDPSLGDSDADWGSSDEGVKAETGASDAATSEATGEDGGEDSDAPWGSFDPTGVTSCAPPPEGMYSACEAPTDCDPSDSCFFWGRGQTLCSRSCADDGDCPGIKGCGAKPTCSREVCTLECSEDEQCPAGMACHAFPVIGANICM